MNYTAANNPKATAFEGIFDIDITLSNGEVIPFSANAADSMDYGRELHARVVSGEFGPIAPYVAPSPEPPAIPQSVTRRQARQALLLAGKLDLVQPAIDAIPNAPQRAMMQIEWDDSQDFERNRPSLIAIGGAIGLDAAGIDALFVQAAAL
jgi:hypothetical protein